MLIFMLLIIDYRTCVRGLAICVVERVRGTFSCLGRPPVARLGASWLRSTLGALRVPWPMCWLLLCRISKAVFECEDVHACGIAGRFTALRSEPVVCESKCSESGLRIHILICLNL